MFGMAVIFQYSRWRMLSYWILSPRQLHRQKRSLHLGFNNRTKFSACCLNSQNILEVCRNAN